MHSLIRNAKLPREFGLRDASGVSGADNDIAFFGRERWIRRHGDSIELVEQVVYGGRDRPPGRTVLGLVSPYGAVGARLASPLERWSIFPSSNRVTFEKQMLHRLHHLVIFKQICHMV